MPKDNQQKKDQQGDPAAYAADVRAEKVDWIWHDRIPRGMLTVLAGKTNQGKGLVTALIAADVTKRGENVIFSAAEDDHGMMTRPRLEAAGADLSRVLLWNFALPDQLDELEQRIVDADIRLIVIDPFNAHLRGVNRFGDKVRDVVLNPLKAIMARTGVSVIVVDHVNKKLPKSAAAIDAIGGSSSGLVAASRMGFIFGVDPDDPDRRVLCNEKFNICQQRQPLAFEIDTEELPIVGEVPALVKQGEIDFDVRKLLEKPKDDDAQVGRKPDKRAAAAEWLTNYLFTAGGPVKSKDVMEDAKFHGGLTQKTLRRAATDMGVVKNPPGGGPKCTWDLPAEVKAAMGGGGNE